MGDTRGAVVIRINGDASSFNNELKKVESQTKDLSGVLTKVGAASALAFTALTAAIGATVVAFREGLKVEQQTQAVLESTGSAAGGTAAQVAALANAFQKTTNFSHESVQAAENIILRYTNIHKDVFPKVIATAVNMAAALGQDVPEAADLLGRALNNPLRAVKLLRSEGIVFTEQQQKQLAAMLDVNDIAGAQALILQKLAKRYGESAEAIASPFAQLRNAVSDVAQEIGSVFNPAAEAAATFMKDFAIDLVENHKELLKFTAYALAAAAAISGIVAALTLGGAAFISARAVLLALTAAAGEGSIAAAIFAGSIEAVGAAITFLFANPIGLAIVALVALGVALYENKEKVVAFFEGAKAAVNSFRDSILPLGAAIAQLIGGILTFSPSTISDALDKIKGPIAQKGAEAGQAFMDAYNESIKNSAIQALPDSDPYNKPKLAAPAADDDYEVEVAKKKERLDLEQQFVDQMFAIQDESQQLERNAAAARNVEIEQGALAEQKLRLSDEAKYGKQIADQKAFWRQNEVKGTGELFSTLSTLTSSKNRELFELGKAAAVASAIVNIAQGITNALSYGPILGPIFAAAVGIAGAVQIATITGTTLQAKEGYSGGGGAFGESFVSTFTPREIVVPERFSDGIKSGQYSLTSSKDQKQQADAGGTQITIAFSGDAAEILELKSLERKKLGIANG